MLKDNKGLWRAIRKAVKLDIRARPILHLKKKKQTSVVHTTATNQSEFESMVKLSNTSRGLVHKFYSTIK